MIDWFKRMRREDTETAERKVWRSRCGRYRIEEVNIRYGRSTDGKGVYLGYPIFFRAMIKRPLGWYVVSAHRKRAAAFNRLEYYDARGHFPRKKGKRNRKLKHGPKGKVTVS
jgi:hypothetical protein